MVLGASKKPAKKSPSPKKKEPKKQKTSPVKAKKKASLKGKQEPPLRSIIYKTNKAAEEINEGIGTRAMEEQAKALAAASPKEQGAWSVEALDLFDWRPPNWEERAKKMGYPDPL